MNQQPSLHFSQTSSSGAVLPYGCILRTWDGSGFLNIYRSLYSKHDPRQYLMMGQSQLQCLLRIGSAVAWSKLSMSSKYKIPLCMVTTVKNVKDNPVYVRKRALQVCAWRLHIYIDPRLPLIDRSTTGLLILVGIIPGTDSSLPF